MERRISVFFIVFFKTADLLPAERGRPYANATLGGKHFSPVCALSLRYLRRGRNQRAGGAGMTRTTALSFEPPGLLSREMKPLPNFEVVTPAPLVLRLTDP